MNQQKISPSAVRSENLMPQSSIVDPAELSVGELLYNFYIATGRTLIGSPDVFAVHLKSINRIVVYSDKMSECCHLRSLNDGLLDTLDVSQGHGANFNVCGDKVVCVLNGVTTQGESYDFAAAYAVLLHAQQTRGYQVIRNQQLNPIQ